MATLESLQEKKRELEAKLEAGDVSAEAALEKVDRAIEARKLTIQHRRKRLDATKRAVDAGMPPEEARRAKTGEKKRAKTKGPLNRF